MKVRGEVDLLSHEVDLYNNKMGEAKKSTASSNPLNSSFGQKSFS